ncbi:MAG: LamG domain-containing protein, partial [Candidatus Andersenbacteria bacterium]
YQYKPVVVYQPGGQRGYMRDLDFENIEEADPPGVLIAYWKFDEGSPEESTVGDSAGSYDGSMINFNQQSAWQAPAPGIQFTNPYSLSFDGNEGRYVDAGDVTELNDAQYFTMAAWMKRGTANSGLVMGKTGGTDGVGVTFGSFNTPYFYVRVANEIGIGNAGYGSFYDPDGDAWHHYAVVYDGTQTGNENRLKVYKDGVQQTLDFEENTVPDRTPDLTDTSFEIGGSLGENYSTGFIDDVRIYSRALFSSEIASLAAGNDVQ